MFFLGFLDVDLVIWFDGAPLDFWRFRSSQTIWEQEMNQTKQYRSYPQRISNDQIHGCHMAATIPSSPLGRTDFADHVAHCKTGSGRQFKVSDLPGCSKTRTGGWNMVKLDSAWCQPRIDPCRIPNCYNLKRTARKLAICCHLLSSFCHSA